MDPPPASAPAPTLEFVEVVVEKMPLVNATAGTWAVVEDEVEVAVVVLACPAPVLSGPATD